MYIPCDRYHDMSIRCLVLYLHIHYLLVKPTEWSWHPHFFSILPNTSKISEKLNVSSIVDPSFTGSIRARLNFQSHHSVVIAVWICSTEQSIKDRRRSSRLSVILQETRGGDPGMTGDWSMSGIPCIFPFLHDCVSKRSWRSTFWPRSSTVIKEPEQSIKLPHRQGIGLREILQGTTVFAQVFGGVPADFLLNQCWHNFHVRLSKKIWYFNESNGFKPHVLCLKMMGHTMSGHPCSKLLIQIPGARWR